MNEMCNNVIDNIIEGLFSEKFIKPHKKNYKNLLILPLLNHKFKCNANVKFRQGETEKILAFEYYQNSYKQCFKTNQIINLCGKTLIHF